MALKDLACSQSFPSAWCGGSYFRQSMHSLGRMHHYLQKGSCQRIPMTIAGLMSTSTCRCSPAIVSILSTSPDPRPPQVPGSWNARSARCWILRYSSYKAVPWAESVITLVPSEVPPSAWRCQGEFSWQSQGSSWLGSLLSAVGHPSSGTWCT